MTLYKATAQGNLPMTPEEEAELERSRAPSPTAVKAAIQAKIDSLEGAPNYMNRGARELQLRLMEKEAAELAADRGLTAEQILTATPYYIRLKALDQEIAQLRYQL